MGQVITRTGQCPDRIALRVEIESHGYASYSIVLKQSAKGFSIPQEECEINNGHRRVRYVVKDGKWEESTVGVTPALAANRLALPLLSSTCEFAPIYEALTQVTYYAPQAHHLFSNGTNIAAGLRQLQLKDQTRYSLIEETLKQMVPTITAIQPQKIGRSWTVEFSATLAWRGSV